jgi:hypothetical protein
LYSKWSSVWPYFGPHESCSQPQILFLEDHLNGVLLSAPTSQSFKGQVRFKRIITNTAGSYTVNWRREELVAPLSTSPVTNRPINEWAITTNASAICLKVCLLTMKSVRSWYVWRPNLADSCAYMEICFTAESTPQVTTSQKSVIWVLLTILSF